jgi:hypothetical protein
MKTRPSKVCSKKWMLIFLFSVATLPILSGCEVNNDRIMEPGVQKTPSSPQYVLNCRNIIRSLDSRPSGFFPLDMGNRWTYSGETFIMVEGGEKSTVHYNEERTIVGTEELFDRVYFLEKQEIIDDTRGDVITYWVRYRQDRAGLYQADVPITDPPNDDEVFATFTSTQADKRKERWNFLCQRISSEFRSDNLNAFLMASNNIYQKLRMIDVILGRQALRIPSLGGPPGGVLPDEITRLRYPLHPRQEWIIRDSPLFESMVIGHEVLDLPAGKMHGFKISIVNELFDPCDVVLLWYGRDGFLRMFAHVETEMVDPSGNPIGTLILEENLILESLELARRNLRVDPANCKHDLIQVRSNKPLQRSSRAGY